jgi:hypothetical protein
MTCVTFDGLAPSEVARVLDGVQRRCPRIVSKVFLKLTRILSNSLERTTRQVGASA